MDGDGPVDVQIKSPSPRLAWPLAWCWRCSASFSVVAPIILRELPAGKACARDFGLQRFFDLLMVNSGGAVHELGFS